MGDMAHRQAFSSAACPACFRLASAPAFGHTRAGLGGIGDAFRDALHAAPLRREECDPMNAAHVAQACITAKNSRVGPPPKTVLQVLLPTNPHHIPFDARDLSCRREQRRRHVLGRAPAPRGETAAQEPVGVAEGREGGRGPGAGQVEVPKGQEVLVHPAGRSGESGGRGGTSLTAEAEVLSVQQLRSLPGLCDMCDTAIHPGEAGSSSSGEPTPSHPRPLAHPCPDIHAVPASQTPT